VLDAAKKNGFAITPEYVQKLAELYDVPVPPMLVAAPTPGAPPAPTPAASPGPAV
jgi:hypothetical protein